MDILLAHGYFISEDAHEQQIMKPYPPLGLLYISSHLKQHGFDVQIFDSTFQTLMQFEQAVQRDRPSLVGLYCNLMTKHNVLRMIDMCNRHGARVILGGPEPVNYAAHYLAAGAEVIVVGEGELTLQELIPQMAKNAPLDGVNGIIFGDGNGEVVHTEPRSLISDLLWRRRADG